MSEHEVVRIPLPDLFFEELDDAFVGEKEDSHDFIWGLLRKCCSDGKMGKLNKSCTITTFKDGQQVNDTVKLRGLELEEIQSDPNWIAKTMEKDEVKYFEHKVTDISWKYLKLFGSFQLLRHDKLKEAIIEANEQAIQKMIDQKKSSEEIQEAQEKQIDGLQKFDENRPTCLEECIYIHIFPQIYRKVTENVDQSLDKENESLYPKEKPQTTKA